MEERKEKVHGYMLRIYPYIHMDAPHISMFQQLPRYEALI